MNLSLPIRAVRLALVGFVLISAGGGCAGLPRIDPSGERILLWPKDQPQAALPAFPTNPTAPPVLTDAAFPTYPATAVGGVPGAPQAVTAALTTPRDTVTITPERILAPVGSEVVLKSGICTADGYTLADQKVEWMLGRNGVGQFVEVSGKGWFHPPLLPWNQPKKVDNYLAYGYTANGPLCITRGTDDPSDDVEILRGDAWISVHSPVEGTSYVTAFAPGVEGWGERRKSAVIYWVDVQWLFPPVEVASSGRPETLTTTVTRQSDGTPVEGWIVKYEVDDGGAAGAAQVAEVRTGADGRASVEVSPTAAGASTSRIRTQLIRPARYSGGAEPQLVVASGETLIRWTGDAPYLPSTQPPLTTPSAPPTTPTIPNIPPAPARKPQLDVEIVRLDAGEVQAGGLAKFEIVVRNVGDATATDVRLNCKFTPGLSHVRDTDNDRQIDTGDLGPLAPGASTSVPLEFNVLQAGQLAHDVTVTCAEAEAVAARATLTARPAPRQAQPGLRIEKIGPAQATAGQSALFRVTVRNTGETPLTNVVVVDEYPAGFLQAKPRQAGYSLVGGNIRWVIPAMQPGDLQQFDVDCLCLQQSLRVTTTATASAETGPDSAPIRNSAEHRLEILPAQGGAVGPGGGGAAPGAGSLRIRVAPTAAEVRAGTRTTVFVYVENASQASDRDVQVRIQVPTSLTIDPNAIQGPSGATPRLLGNEIQFAAVNEIRPAESFTYMITVTATQAGFPEIVAQAASRSTPAPVLHRATIEITGR
ncbi:MAG: hypothetical protein KF688_05630 [Pirellulales bacterium]|nr:hypothetical protein [Pirellulales bacterium]